MLSGINYNNYLSTDTFKKQIGMRMGFYIILIRIAVFNVKKKKRIFEVKHNISGI